MSSDHLLSWLFGTQVDLDRDDVVKFFPSNPPRRYERVLVNGEPHRVTYCRTKWDGNNWAIKSLRVRRAS